MKAKQILIAGAVAALLPFAAAVAQSPPSQPQPDPGLAVVGVVVLGQRRGQLPWKTGHQEVLGHLRRH